LKAAGALSPGRHVGLVLCGGNIDPLRLQAIIGRGMVRAGRLARVRVEARDAPGVLARLTAAVARCGANIEEVHHQRAFTALPRQAGGGRTRAADAPPRAPGSA
jgi:threonine dehydratase